MPRPNTSAALITALYFKAAWDETFQEKLTKDADFWLTNGSSVKTPTMHLSGRAAYFENSEWQALQLTYDRGAYTYLLLLPRGRLAPSEVASKLSTSLIMSALKSSGYRRVNLSLPRHKIKQNRNIIGSVRSIVGELPFSSRADYSGITSLKLAIEEIIHEAVVHVDESGTEAAAATAVIMAKSAFMIDEDPKEVVADHPFAFAIIHTESGSPLFIGVVGEPSTAG